MATMVEPQDSSAERKIGVEATGVVVVCGGGVVWCGGDPAKGRRLSATDRLALSESLADEQRTDATGWNGSSTGAESEPKHGATLGDCCASAKPLGRWAAAATATTGRQYSQPYSRHSLAVGQSNNVQRGRKHLDLIRACNRLAPGGNTATMTADHTGRP